MPRLNTMWLQPHIFQPENVRIRCARCWQLTPDTSDNQPHCLCRTKDQEVQELMETASQSDRGLEAAERQAAEVGILPGVS